MARPLSIKIFAFLFAASGLLSFALAVATSRSMVFGVTLTPQAAETLAQRIYWVRLAGLGFAAVLFALVLFARSAAARGALLLRWTMALLSSVAFLRGIGIVPAEGTTPTIVAASVAQLGIEGLAIVVLYGPDAAAWFAAAPIHTDRDDGHRLSRR